MVEATAERVQSPSQALTRGLEVLRVVSESKQHVTSTEIARRVGLHQSWVSRVLRTLADAGYVRKPDYHSFAADYGVLALGGNALQQFPYIVRPKKALAEIAARCPGMQVVLATLWRGQLLYLARVQHGHESVPLSVGFPLHLSSVGLRMLAAMPDADALSALEISRQNYGWERPTKKIPANPKEALRFARDSIRHDCTVLEDYYLPKHIGAAIPIEAKGEPMAALAITGPDNLHSVDTILLLLQEGRRSVEAAMAQK